MANLLPLFPLNIVVFPGEKLNLHIFEPRYRQLIHDCLQAGTTFGMPSFIGNLVTEYGTEIKLLSVEKKYPGGELDIKTKGTRVIRIKEFHRLMPGKQYAAGEVAYPEDEDEAEEPVVKIKLSSLLRQLYQALRVENIFLSPSDSFTAYDIGHHVGLSLEQEYQLLQLRSETARQEFLLNHLQHIVPVVEETERLKERIKLNGHYINLLPPEF